MLIVQSLSTVIFKCMICCTKLLLKLLTGDLLSLLCHYYCWSLHVYLLIELKCVEIFYILFADRCQLSDVYDLIKHSKSYQFTFGIMLLLFFLFLLCCTFICVSIRFFKFTRNPQPKRIPFFVFSTLTIDWLNSFKQERPVTLWLWLVHKTQCVYVLCVCVLFHSMLFMYHHDGHHHRLYLHIRNSKHISDMCVPCCFVHAYYPVYIILPFNQIQYYIILSVLFLRISCVRISFVLCAEWNKNKMYTIRIVCGDDGGGNILPTSSASMLLPLSMNNIFTKQNSLFFLLTFLKFITYPARPADNLKIKLNKKNATIKKSEARWSCEYLKYFNRKRLWINKAKSKHGMSGKGFGT